jgi:hypothetical protein
MNKTFFILVFTLLSIGTFASAEDNYCIDKKSWQEWDNPSEKYPSDIDIQTLHALRLGLCAKVEREDIKVQQATDIFENARDNVVIKKKVESFKEENI